METKTLLTKEVQENFFNEMRNEYQPWLDAIADNDFAKFEALLADEVEMYTSLTQLILRYGSPKFQRTFTNTYSLGEESALCFLEYGNEQCVVEWLEAENPKIWQNEFEIILKRNSIKIFAQAIAQADIAEGCYKLMKEVTSLPMLVVYYSMVDGSAPEGFWDNPDVAKLLKENLEVIKKVNYLTFSKLHKFEELRKFILLNGYLTDCDEDLLIELSQNQASPEEFEEAKKVFSQWTSEQKCAELIKLNPELVLQMTDVVPETTLIRAALMAQNTEVLLKAFEGNCSYFLVSDLTNELIEYPDLAAVLASIKGNDCAEAIWKKLIKLRKIDLLLELLNNPNYDFCYEFPKELECDLLDLRNYKINRAYLDQYALADDDHEEMLFELEDSEEREKLVTWYYEKYGFHSKVAEVLWDNMQRKKLNTFMKRLKFLFGS